MPTPMLYQDILIPTDGSSGTERTLEHGLTIARNHGATVHALYVVDRRLYLSASDDEKTEVKERLSEEGEQAIETVRRGATEHDLPVETAIRTGNPEKEILEYADAHDVDLVVMGSHGKTAREKVMGLGSVSEGVTKNADRPVLVVRLDGE